MKTTQDIEFIGGAKIVGIKLEDFPQSAVTLRIIKQDLTDEYHFFDTIQAAIDFAHLQGNALDKIIILRTTLIINSAVQFKSSIKLDFNNFGLISSTQYFDYFLAQSSDTFSFLNVNTRYEALCHAINVLQNTRNSSSDPVIIPNPPLDYTPSLVPYTPNVKGIYYVPRLSKDNFWLTNWANGEFTEMDILNDFEVMKNHLGINTIRVFTFFDIEYRKNPNATSLIGLSDGKGNYNEALFEKLGRFIDLAKMAGLNVLPTLFQELKALKATDDWSFLENDISYFKAFTDKMIRLFASKTNIQYVMLKNEPDGYGVWNDTALASRVLTFLSEIKKSATAISTRIKYLVNSVTHDNIYKKYPNAIANSIYKITDVVCCNSFLFTDTGYWNGINYRTQIEYLVNNDVLKKGVIITECGFPSNYVNQRVTGYPDENGVISSVTDESTIPINDAIFDRPKGRAVGVAHTEQSQYIAIAEATYWVQRKGLKGFLVWSAFDHAETSIRDSFAVINFDNSPKMACNIIKATYRNIIADDFGNRISLQQGAINGTGVINGLVGNSAGVTGVRVSAGSNWISEQLLYDYPFAYRMKVMYLEECAEPFTIGIVTNETSFQIRYKKYDKNAFELFDLGNNVSVGWCNPLNLDKGTEIELTIEIIDNKPVISLGTTVLNFVGTMNIQPWQLNNIRLQLFGVQSSVEIHELYADGNVGYYVSLIDIPAAP